MNIIGTLRSGLLICVCVTLCSARLYANAFSSSPYNAIGLSADFIIDRKGDPVFDGELDLSYRNGFISLVTVFLTADAGYQFREKSLNGRAGAQGMILFFGLEAGYTHKYIISDKKHLPGMYSGIICALPADRDNLLSLSLGGNFYRKSESEFYLRFTTVYNFPN